MIMSAAMDALSILFFSPVSVRLNDDDVDDVDETDGELPESDEDPDKEMKQYITDDEDEEEEDERVDEGSVEKNTDEEESE